MGDDRGEHDAEEQKGGEVGVSEEPHGVGCGGPANHSTA